jgi:phage repressor protein C with HTH and peptisase S24 domain
MPLISPSSGANDDFIERLRLWRVSQNLTQAEAAQILKVSRSYFSQIEQGKRNPSKKLQARFDIASRATSHSGNVEGRAPRLRTIPILSWAQAGEATAFEQIPSDWDEFVPSDVADERAFGVRLRGDSMEPKFSDGDIAILLPSTAPTNGEIVVANIRNQGALCKIMHVQLDKKLVKLSSYNPAYPPTEYHRDEFNWIYPVAAIIKQLRRR